MTQNEVLEGDKLIAQFMGERYKPANFNNTGNKEEWEHQGIFYNELQYNSSFDWLMPVVEKIEALGYEVRIAGINCSIGICEDVEEQEYNWLAEGFDTKKITATHQAVTSFIKWYNANK